METRDHSKNGASLKSQMSRGKFTVLSLTIFIISLFFFCSMTQAQNKNNNQEKKVYKNTRLIFEDERKTFAIYACWNIITQIDKGQYGDEHNVYYLYELMYQIKNNNDKILVINFNRHPSTGSMTSVKPNGEDDISDFGNAISIEFDKKTGEIKFGKLNISFRFL